MFFPKNDQHLSDFKICLLFLCNKSQNQVSKTLLKQIKTIFGLNSHSVTHNLCWGGGGDVKISIFCENHEFGGISTNKQKNYKE